MVKSARSRLERRTKRTICSSTRLILRRICYPKIGDEAIPANLRLTRQIGQGSTNSGRSSDALTMRMETEISFAAVYPSKIFRRQRRERPQQCWQLSVPRSEKSESVR